jgi:hypothetical protein
LSIGWNVDFVRKVLFQFGVAAAETVLKNVGHGDQFDLAVVDLECVFRRSSSTATTADQGNSDFVVFGSVYGSRQGRGKAGSGCEARSGLQETSAIG